MVLLIDNYDSFTYNLAQYIEQMGYVCEVKRNDQITLQEIEQLAPEKIVLSPGPGYPIDAGITLDVIHRFMGRIPLLGVCLGHQAIGEAFGAVVVRAPRPLHGKLSRITHNGKGSFAGLKPSFQAARYHSLVIAKETLPSCLEITAETDDGLIMGVRHKQFAIEGFQFHPELVATEGGFDLLKNFLESHPKGISNSVSESRQASVISSAVSSTVPSLVSPLAVKNG